jgi:hypothetical protein
MGTTWRRAFLQYCAGAWHILCVCKHQRESLNKFSLSFSDPLGSSCPPCSLSREQLPGQQRIWRRFNCGLMSHQNKEPVPSISSLGSQANIIVHIYCFCCAALQTGCWGGLQLLLWERKGGGWCGGLVNKLEGKSSSCFRSRKHVIEYQAACLPFLEWPQIGWTSYYHAHEWEQVGEAQCPTRKDTAVPGF